MWLLQAAAECLALPGLVSGTQKHSACGGRWWRLVYPAPRGSSEAGAESTSPAQGSAAFSRTTPSSSCRFQRHSWHAFLPLQLMNLRTACSLPPSLAQSRPEQARPGTERNQGPMGSRIAPGHQARSRRPGQPLSQHALARVGLTLLPVYCPFNAAYLQCRFPDPAPVPSPPPAWSLRVATGDKVQSALVALLEGAGLLALWGPGRPL